MTVDHVRYTVFDAKRAIQRHHVDWQSGVVLKRNGPNGESLTST